MFVIIGKLGNGAYDHLFSLDTARSWQQYGTKTDPETGIKYCDGTDENADGSLKFGGAACMLLIGMLTCSQSTTQNVVFSFFGPALVATGITPVFAAVAGSHLAAAGQGMPPADLTCFVVCGIVSAQFGKKVDPVKSMIYALPMCIALLVIGFVFMYI